MEITDEKESVSVTNTGDRAGAEVVQVYISADAKTTSIARPKKELKGFRKVFLQPGELKRVRIPLDRFSTSFWDEVLGSWVSEKGLYSVQVGRSSAEILLEGVYEIKETSTWSGL